jgi:mediator of RNA polymerase II transcription subunit 23
MQDLLSKAISNLSFFIWTHELLPLDILLLALIDRDDDPYALRLVVKPQENSQVSLPISRIMLNHTISLFLLILFNFEIR